MDVYDNIYLLYVVKLTFFINWRSIDESLIQ